VTRHVQVTRLRPEKREEYLRLHADVWPAVQERIRASNLRDYSILLEGDLLIGVFEYVGDDIAADMAAMAADPETQRWWALTDPCQEALPGADGRLDPDGGPWRDAREIWRLP
jgi:L-rhamnose mutarotase